MDNSYNSASTYFRAIADQAEKNLREEQNKKLNSETLLKIVNQLEEQNKKLQEQLDETKKQLNNSDKANKRLLFWAIFSGIVATATLIVTVLIAILK